MWPIKYSFLFSIPDKNVMEERDKWRRYALALERLNEQQRLKEIIFL